MNKKIIELLRNSKKAAKSGSLEEISKSLKEIKQLLVISLLKDNLEDLSGLFGTDKPSAPVPQPSKVPGKPEITSKDDKSLKILGDIATTKHEEGITYYLLHRPMDSFEYDASDAEGSNELTLDKITDWYAETDGWQDLQQGNHPVVSCWIDEKNIVSVINPEPNTGTWGDLGGNPNKYNVKARVKAGTYTIYQELRQ